MKVIAKERTLVEKELDLEYPFYLYFQKESCEDEWVKVYPDYKIVIEFNYFGVTIKTEYNGGYSEHEIVNNITTEKLFNSSFKEALENLIELKG